MSVSDAPPLEVMSHRGVQDLVERIRSGDSHAFEEIIRLHERRVLAMAIQMGLSPQDAQDVCQEVFLRVFRYLSGFRAGLVFEAWLCRIAVHVIYDALRKRRDRGEISWEGAFGPQGETSAQTAGLHLGVENADLCGKLLDRMQVLTPQERMVFVLRDLQDLDTLEVARALRVSPITVRRHSATARQKLKEVLRALIGRDEEDSHQK